MIIKASIKRDNIVATFEVSDIRKTDIANVIDVMLDKATSRESIKDVFLSTFGITGALHPYFRDEC